MAITTNDGVLIAFIDTYGDIASANDYFLRRLKTDAWDSASDDDKLKALRQATRAIDRLNFTGDKASDTQILQFPRGNDTVVPTDIEYATYEEALQLLSDVDIQSEVDGLNITSNSFASVKTTYDRKIVSEHLMSGIVSYIAWTYLIPYLRDHQELKLIRS
jgi:hypothetical protein